MKKLFILFLFLLLIPLTLAVKPSIISSEFLTGYTLESPIIEGIKVNNTYRFHTHIYNSTNGKPIISGVGCYFHLFNESGNHILQLQDYQTSNTFDYEFNVDGGNFTRPGIYSALISCNDSNQGGFKSAEIPVTYSGYQSDNAQAVQAGLTVIGFILLGFLIIFTFIKIGNAISVESWATLALKILLYCLSMLFLFLPVSFLNPMIELSRRTIPNFDIATGLGSNALGLYNSLFSSLRLAILAVGAFGFIYLVYLIYQALLSNADKNSKGFDKGGGNNE